MPKKKPIILAIETSADETSAAVFKNGKIASNIIYSQILQHRKTGGIVPEVAARAHIPKIIPALKWALKKAKTNLKKIDAIAVTAGPGLVTSLRIGVDTAKTLSFALDKPIIPINHLEGHLLSAFPTNYKLKATSLLPAVGLVVSGGHTMLVLVKGIGKYKILGETLDDAAGEAFDKIAKIMGLAYPGGPEISKLAQKGDPNAFDLPRPLLNRKNYDFSFSGLKTHVLYLWRDLKNKNKQRANLAASVEQAIVDVLVEKTIRAAVEHKTKTILLGGGVAANQKLRKTLNKRTKGSGLQLLTPDLQLTGDNAGMIALAANYHFLGNDLSNYGKIKADPNLRLRSWR